jgi:hypothetical protein
MKKSMRAIFDILVQNVLDERAAIESFWDQLLSAKTKRIFGAFRKRFA